MESARRLLLSTAGFPAIPRSRVPLAVDSWGVWRGNRGVRGRDRRIYPCQGVSAAAIQDRQCPVDLCPSATRLGFEEASRRVAASSPRALRAYA